MRSARWLSAAAAMTLVALTAPAATVAAAAAAPPEWQPVARADFNGDKLPTGCGKYGGPHGGPAAGHRVHELFVIHLCL
jgi:hypothetical protein